MHKEAARKRRDCARPRRGQSTNAQADRHAGGDGNDRSEHVATQAGENEGESDPAAKAGEQLPGPNRPEGNQHAETKESRGSFIKDPNKTGTIHKSCPLRHQHEMKRRGATKLEGEAKEERREKRQEEGKAVSPHGGARGGRQVGDSGRGETRLSAAPGVSPT